MKNLLLLLLLLFLMACGNRQVAPEKQEVEKLTLIEVQRSERSSWYEDFNGYREYYRKFKVNSELVLAIGGYEVNPKDAFDSAVDNGEKGISNILGLNNTNEENGIILDQALEVYNKGNQILYRYLLLMEVNKVSAYNIAKEEERLVLEAKAKLEQAKKQAKVEVGLGDEAYLRKDYEEAILYYEKALLLYESEALYTSAEGVREKIEKVDRAIETDNYRINTERIEREKRIAKLENLKNPSLYDLEELLSLYKIKGEINRISEVEERIRVTRANEQEQIDRLALESYIKNLVKTGYEKLNYVQLMNNYSDYVKNGEVDISKVKEVIESDISKKTLYLLMPRDIYYNENNQVIAQGIQDKNPNLLVRTGVYSGGIDVYDYYRYKSYKILYLNKLDLTGIKGDFGYFANLSMSGTYIDYESGERKSISIGSIRSTYTDYTSSLGAKEAVVEENIVEF